jgi:hypothetical protein
VYIDRFELVEPIGLNEHQLKDIPYENIKYDMFDQSIRSNSNIDGHCFLRTASQPFRISLSPHSARRRRSSPFNRAG